MMVCPLTALVALMMACEDKPAATPWANAAPQKNPLFVNMTTGDSWRGWMGLHFAHSTLKMGHPVAIFLNLEAVKLAAKDGEQEKKPSMQRVPREILADFMRDLKRGSSSWVHSDVPLKTFAWQEGYAAITVSPSGVDEVRRYIENQEEHHRERSSRDELKLLLERSGINYDARFFE